MNTAWNSVVWGFLLACLIYYFFIVFKEDSTCSWLKKIWGAFIIISLFVNIVEKNIFKYAYI